MFEMKYDKDRNPIVDPNLKATAEQPTPTEAPVSEPDKPFQEPIAQAQEETVQEEVQVQPEVVEHKPATETPKEQSLRILRERAEKAEQEKYLLLKRLNDMEQQRQQASAPIIEDTDINLGSDDYAQGQHLSKVQKKIKHLEDQLKQYHQQSSTTAVEAKLKAQYSDFDKVVSPDNIEMLRNAYPELAATLNANNDLYSKAVSAYTLIKKFGIHQDEPFSSDKLRAQTNAAKPKPLASISPQQGESPLSRANAFANGLTEELKTQLKREMDEARKNY